MKKYLKNYVLVREPISRPFLFFKIFFFLLFSTHFPMISIMIIIIKIITVVYRILYNEELYQGLEVFGFAGLFPKKILMYTK